jgi:hypothetical protein
MKPSKQPPAAFSAVLRIDESAALRLLSWPDTPANRETLRRQIPHTGDRAAPSYLHAEIVHYGRTGQPLPTASRGIMPDMKRRGDLGPPSAGTGRV